MRHKRIGSKILSLAVAGTTVAFATLVPISAFAQSGTTREYSTAYIQGPLGPVAKIETTITRTTTCVQVTCPPAPKTAALQTKAATVPGGTCQSCSTNTTIDTKKFWLHTDHQGSIHVESNVAGAEAARFTYKPYGDHLGTNSSLPGPESLGYTGQRQDSSTGLFYLHARYYDPVLGRFISPDPIVPGNLTVHLNRYAYADNNPINKTDVSGMQADSDATKVKLPDLVKGSGANPFILPEVTITADAPAEVDPEALAHFFNKPAPSDFMSKQTGQVNDNSVELAAAAAYPGPTLRAALVGGAVYGATGNPVLTMASTMLVGGPKTDLPDLGKRFSDVKGALKTMKDVVKKTERWKNETKILPMVMTHDTEFFDAVLRKPLVAPIMMQTYKGKPVYSSPISGPTSLENATRSLNQFLGGSDYMWMHTGELLSPREFMMKYYKFY
ncbi:MAG: RHS repeat-associated core domain-containing protein [Pseudomonadota bacterium]